MDEIRKIPPVTRTILLTTIGLTVPMLLGLLSPHRFVLIWPAVLRRWQVWRPITAFFFGGQGLQLLFDCFLLLRNSTDLELNTFYRSTSEYTWALFLINSIIILTNYPLRSIVLFKPMLYAILYLWAQANPSAQMSFFGLINTPARYVPYAYLLLDLVQGGMPAAMQGATGLISAHIYYFFRTVLPATNGGRGPNVIPSAPSWLRQLLPDSPDPAAQGHRPQPGGSVRSTSWGGTAFAPRDRSFNAGFSAPNSTGPRSVGSSHSPTSRLTSWLPFYGGSGRRAHSSNNSSNAQNRPDREAMLAAAEARLQSIRANSIAGRNEASRAAATQALNSREAVARASKSASGSTSKEPVAGQAIGSTKESRATGVREPGHVARRVAAGNGGTSFSFNSQTPTHEDQETASGSGGRVAEVRRAPRGDEEEFSSETSDAKHTWGQGRRLND